LRFDLLLGVGDGVGEAFLPFAEAVGQGVGVGFFVECFRCLRVGVGLGSGSRTFLIFEPNDSSAEGAASMPPNKIIRIRSDFMFDAVVSAVLSGDSSPVVRPDALKRAHTILRGDRQAGRRLGRTDKDVCATTVLALEGLLCSNEFRLRNFREENFRLGSVRGNLAARVP